MHSLQTGEAKIGCILIICTDIKKMIDYKADGNG